MDLGKSKPHSNFRLRRIPLLSTVSRLPLLRRSSSSSAPSSGSGGWLVDCCFCSGIKHFRFVTETTRIFQDGYDQQTSFTHNRKHLISSIDVRGSKNKYSL